MRARAVKRDAAGVVRLDLVPLMTIVVTWSSFAVDAVRMFARAFANEGSGAGCVVVAACCESLPQPTRSSPRTAAIRARRTRRSLEMDRAHALRARLSGRADDVDESGRRGRQRDARVHGDVAHTRGSILSTAQSIPRHDDVVGNERDPEPRRRETHGALSLRRAHRAPRARTLRRGRAVSTMPASPWSGW